MPALLSSLLGQPYLLDELQEDAVNKAKANIATRGATRRSIVNFCIIFILN